MTMVHSYYTGLVKNIFINHPLKTIVIERRFRNGL